MIQIVNVPYAYPLTYTTYGNIDFGTVKGLSISYDIARRTVTSNYQPAILYSLLMEQVRALHHK